MADTRAMIKQLVADYPNATASEIARSLGVSRQRVAQILDSEGIELTREVLSHDGRYYPAGARQRRLTPPVARILTGGLPVALNATAVGTASELLVAADLTARGFYVFFPLVRTALCDLVTVDKSGAVQKIEVCSARRDTAGAVKHPPKDRARSDRLAFVLTGEPIVYRPPFEGENTGHVITPKGE